MDRGESEAGDISEMSILPRVKCLLHFNKRLCFFAKECVCVYVSVYVCVLMISHTQVDYCVWLRSNALDHNERSCKSLHQPAKQRIRSRESKR